MQGLMYKFGERRDDWKCCFCCHVRAGTIFLGIWHLMLHVLALSVIAVVVRHPELMVEQDAPALPTPLSEVDSKLIHSADSPSSDDLMYDDKSFSHSSYRTFFNRRTLDYQDLNVGVMITFCTFAITLLMVYGAIRGKPSYLMPFFCLQVFDFCIASLTALSYLCYLPNMHRLVAESPRIPMQSELLSLPPQCLSLIVFLTFVIAMLVKAYFIGVVWSCYKYLTLRLVAAQSTIHFIDPEVPDVQGLLPDYDTAVKFPTPPPSYASATAGPEPAPPQAQPSQPPRANSG